MIYASTGATAAQAAIAQAIKASGTIVHVENQVFSQLVSKADDPLVIMSETKIFKTTYTYLLHFKGFCFYTKSSIPLSLSRHTLIVAKKIWVPSM